MHHNFVPDPAIGAKDPDLNVPVPNVDKVEVEAQPVAVSSGIVGPLQLFNLTMK